jgi:AraC-like DNA-binding protein
MTRERFEVRRLAHRGIEAVAATSARRFARHAHDQFGIGVICRGAQASASGRGPVEAGPGDLITVNPGEVHDGAPIGDSRTWRMLYLRPELVGQIVEDLRHDGPGLAEFAHPAATRPRSARLFGALYGALEGPGAGPVGRADADWGLQVERLTVLVADLLRETPAGPPPPQGYPAAVLRARAAIDDDPSGAHALAELAELTGLSRWQLLRGFSRATGLTPHAYLVQRRLALSRRLIAGGTSLAEAAAAAGFADQSHMTRHFVRAFGYPPGTYAAG